MPNFQTKALNPLEFPHSQDGVEFKWVAKCDNNSLIFTTYNDEVFFLKEIVRDRNILIKGDKLAKPSRVKILQNALIAYEKATNSKPEFSNIHTSKNRHEKHSDFLKDIDYFANDFISEQKSYDSTCVEVGFGSGRHLLYKAKQNPKALHVGIEIHKPSIEQVIKQCEIQGISNIIIVDMDARVLMEFFPSNSISQIFVHFPIPWDKKPHRRVISDEFLHEAKRVLSENGRLELRTDSDLYFEYSLNLMLSQKSIFIEICKNKDIEISSKYEDRWKKQEKNIYDLVFINKEISKSKNIPSELKFPLHVKENNFKKGVVLEKNWFVNYEKCYNIDEKNFLWQIAFGDTAHGEHCYVLVCDEKASYFPRKMYATKNNLNAHRQISETLVNEKSN